MEKHVREHTKREEPDRGKTEICEDSIKLTGWQNAKCKLRFSLLKILLILVTS